MANVRVKDKTAMLYSGVAAGDVFFITDVDVDVDKKIVASELKKYVLENKAIGGAAAGDVTTNNATQTLTGKTLTIPKLNENVAVTVTATQVNNACATTSTTAELNLNHTYASKIPFLANVTSDIQAQINGLGLSPIAFSYVYGRTFVAAGTTEDIKEADILTALGLSTSLYYVDYTSLHGTTCSVSGNTYTVIDDTTAASPNVLVSWTTQVTSGVTHLDTLSITGMTNAESYNVAFTFKIFEIPGI